MSNMEMQEQSILNEMMCDEVHEIEDGHEQQDYKTYKTYN